jgi:hypothetical protein
MAANYSQLTESVLRAMQQVKVGKFLEISADEC